MTLNVGLISPSLMWEQMLLQEGVASRRVELNGGDPDCSVLVVNRVLQHSERKSVETYLSSGGAVLGFAGHLAGVCKTSSRTARIDFLTSDVTGIFSDIHLLDLAVSGEIPREANCLRTQHNEFAAYAGELGGGYAVILPFDIAGMMEDRRAVVKNFYAIRDRLPSERVSAVGKGELRHVLHYALRYLHHVRNLPYVHVWYFPDGKMNVSAFRIDSDKGSKKEVDELYHLAVEHDCSMTWFLDVKSHEEWLHHFAFLAGQETGVHCYEHRTYDSYEENLKNISKAKRKLELAGISSPGFAAPFGIWNTGLAQAIDKAVFEYSSEFSYAYDTLPFYPSVDGYTFLTPQIPVHPICIGSLRKVGYTSQQMKEYFKRVIDEKLLRDEPLFFYHHPTHHYPDVVRFIFRYLEEKEIDNMTMLEFARWWRKRLKYISSFNFEGSRLAMQPHSSVDDSVWIRIIRPDGAEVLVQPSLLVELARLEWNPQRHRASAPTDIRRIREFDPRGLVGEVFSGLAQRFTRKGDGR
ncbi:MAG: hypothetical protein KF749_18270 [Bacteroidetes bacterium]|nr:hypothetical protein [Bacteroidota bacterium]MCW5895265.1 hypothetical protein [Bacteroidota bacterium]